MVPLPVQGKIYKSPFAGFRVQTRSEAVHYHPNTGVEINRTKPLTAEFGLFGEELMQELPDGTYHVSANISGGYFDSAQAAESLGWSDEEHESVLADLERWSVRWPEALQLVSKQPADLPWAKYNETHHNQIPTLAEATGLVAEALAYERENKNRESVVSKLEELQNAAPEPVSEESLTAA